ncbi:hypothetical protein MUY27_01070 [Mucilaginibacter sp. RS28]|uniref:Adhesin domain-containing protein n=1 Tax=Mucilaginibacter straminoryzae TaxID=2932774 RepID=A0A9X2BBH7_9SPHI|nr:hypothetical protein [Mucilaginibacter straminoryzae]MCJ8208278.1 hypothetical protein [Mucilaginibacter straminoryzae]
MKTKIFNTLLMAIACIVAGFSPATAQQAVTITPAVPLDNLIEPLPALDLYTLSADTYLVTSVKDSSYRKEMKKLQEQMRSLQTQMNKLRTDEFRKQALAMADSNRKRVTKTYSFNLKSGDLTNSLKSFGNITITGDDYLKKKIESGEVKEKTKTYTKSYNVDRDDQIQIDNRFGKVTVNTWNKNEVKVEVQVKADANEEEDAQKLLDNVTISDSKDGSLVSFKTNIGGESGSWGTWFNLGKVRTRKIEVNYTVYMPIKNSLSITNRYGNTELPELLGKVVVDNAYGSFTAKTLNNPACEIKVRYGSARIDNLVGSDLNVAYGNLVVGESDKLNADISYGSAKIGKIKTTGNINARFSGTIQVSDVDKNLKNLAVNCSYSSVKLGLGNDQNADFDVTVKYGSFKYDDLPVSITSKSPEEGDRGFSATHVYKGKVGKGNSDKVIVIKSTFGSVKFD